MPAIQVPYSVSLFVLAGLCEIGGRMARLAVAQGRTGIPLGIDGRRVFR